MNQRKSLLDGDTFFEDYGFDVFRKQSRNFKERRQSKSRLSQEDAMKLGEANMLFSERKLKEAVAILHKLIEAQPNVPDPYLTLGHVYKDMGRLGESIDCLIIAAKLSPKASKAENSQSLWTSVYEMCEQLEDAPRTLVAINKLLKFKKDPALMLQRCRILAESEETEKAIQAYIALLAEFPLTPSAAQELAEIYYVREKTQEAKEVLEQLLNAQLKEHQTNSNVEIDLNSANMLCQVYISRSEWNEGVKLLQIIERVGSLPIDLAISFGICRIHLGQLQLAQEYFESLHRLAPESRHEYADLYEKVADAYYAVGQFESAISFYEDLLGLSEYEDTVQWLKLARCHTLAGNPSLALHYYEKVLEVDPANSFAIMSLSAMCTDTVVRDKAIELINKYVQASQLDIGDENERRTHTPEEIPPLVAAANIHFMVGEYDAYLKIALPLLHDQAITKGIFKKKLQSDPVKRAKYLSGGQNSIASILDNEVYLNLLVRTGVLVTYVRQNPDQTIALLERHFEFSLTQAGFSWEQEHLILLYWLLYKSSIAANDSARAINYMRKIVMLAPTNPGILSECCKLESRLHIIVCKSATITKWSKTYKDELAMQIFLAIHYHNSNLNRIALYHLMLAYKLKPDSELVLLLLGACYLNLSFSRETSDRHTMVFHGFAFLSQYCQMARHSLESKYNLARGYQQLGLHFLAVPLYESVLAHDLRFPDFSAKSKSARNNSKKQRSQNGDEMIAENEEENLDIEFDIDESATASENRNNTNGDLEEDSGNDPCDELTSVSNSATNAKVALKRNAAYNLAQIYAGSGNHEMARKVLMENIVI